MLRITRSSNRKTAVAVAALLAAIAAAVVAVTVGQAAAFGGRGERAPEDLANCFAFSIDQVGRGNLEAGIDRFDDCLADDYTFEFVFFEGGPSIVCPGPECPIQEFSSRADLRARFANDFFVDAGYLATQHQVLNVDVTRQGRRKAEVFAYIQANHFLPDNSVDIAWNDYSFTAARERGGWVVKNELIVGTAFLNFEGGPAGGDPEPPGPAVPTVFTRDSGLVVTVQEAAGVTVHTLTAPEAVFANSTHLIETDNSLVAFDTQFLLPNAVDMRDYAGELGKPIDRVFITHEHPDHFLGSEAFDDLPIYALQEVSDLIAANGDAEVAEKQADFGPELIAGTYVIPEVVSPGTIEIDGVTFELEQVVDAEAENQLVIRLPDHGVVVTGDIVYSGVHLILAGQPDTWTVALQELAATGDQYPIVLPGHGAPADPSVYDANIEWLATAARLIGEVDNGDDFRQGLIDAFPELGMEAAIDFVLPFLFPEG